MAITGIGSSYNSSIYGNTCTAKDNETSKAGTEEQTRRTAQDELSYLTEKYECLKNPGYSVNINSSLLEKATSDEKTSEWLEYNLSLLPNVVENIKSFAASRGAKLISCNITINGYDSITTEVLTQDVVDPGTEKAREELKERIKERRQEKKAQEEKAAKRRAEKRAEKKAAKRRAETKADGEAHTATKKYTVSVTGTDIKDVAQKVISASLGISAPSGTGFNVTV